MTSVGTHGPAVDPKLFKQLIKKKSHGGTNWLQIAIKALGETCQEKAILLS